MASVDIPTLRQLVDEGYLTCRPHPTANLCIWNYTPKTQFERYWTLLTRKCRGLITTSDGEVVARPFEKFFNIEEYDDISLFLGSFFKVTEKVDGSLGILYFVGDEPFIATRGSFTSEQAVQATRILQERFGALRYLFKKKYTYLFEIVYPANRIVVDYGLTEDLVLLAIIVTETGEELDIHDDILALTRSWPELTIVKHYDGIKDIAELKALEEENKEGFVIRFESGLRAKAKFSEYVRLHRLITQTTARTVWEYLKESRSLSELYDRVPEEFSQWLKATSKDLSGKYEAIYRKTQTLYKEITQNASIPLMLSLGASLSVRDVEIISRAMKKHIQQEFARYPDVEPFLLMMYSGGTDKKEKVRVAIWETLKPEATRPFRNEYDDEGKEKEAA